MTDYHYIKAIPTRFKGILYRSRLEATWAVFWEEVKRLYLPTPFDYQHEWADIRALLVDSPNQKVKDYKPDFTVGSLVRPGEKWPLSFALEVKPIWPNSDYLKILREAAYELSKCRLPLFLAVGGFRDEEPPYWYHFPYLENWPQYLCDIVMESVGAKALEVACNMRWDIYESIPNRSEDGLVNDTTN